MTKLSFENKVTLVTGAAIVQWLCSPGTGFVIDHALTVDGGFTAQQEIKY